MPSLLPQALSWSPDSQHILSGSVDNTSIVWDAVKGKASVRMADHQHYIQGVAWDPAGRFLVTQSGDRTCRVYAPVLPSNTSKKQRQQAKQEFQPQYLTCMHILSKRELEQQQEQQPPETPGNPADAETPSTQLAAKAAKHCLFHDDTIPSFFRRLAWSPDGSFLALPTGQYKRDAAAATLHTLYLYSRRSFNRPAAHVPGTYSPSPHASLFLPPISFRPLCTHTMSTPTPTLPPS
eukprot:8762912-Pyramimonas_sp.AAC.2